MRVFSVTGWIGRNLRTGIVDNLTLEENSQQNLGGFCPSLLFRLVSEPEISIETVSLEDAAGGALDDPALEDQGGDECRNRHENGDCIIAEGADAQEMSLAPKTGP